MQISFWIWLALLIIAVVVELISTDMTSIWFAVGALVALILAIFPEVAWYVQLPVFLVVSFVLLLALRPIAKKYLSRHDNTKTNVDALTGQRVVLLTVPTATENGTVMIGDVKWSVSSDNPDEEFSVGESVEIAEVRGNKLVIKKSEL